MSDKLDLGIIGGEVLRRLSGRALGVACCSAHLEAGVIPTLERVQHHPTIDTVGAEGIVLRGYATPDDFERGGTEQFCLVPWNRILNIELASPKLVPNRNAPATAYGVETQRGGLDGQVEARFKEVQEEVDRQLKGWQSGPDASSISMVRKAATILYAALQCGCRADSVADFVNGYLDTSRNEVSWIVNRLEDNGIWRAGGTLGWNITSHTDDAFWIAVYLVTGQVILLDS